MTTQIKSAQHLEEQELNRLLKYLYQNKLWTYYLLVRLGVSTALRFSDLSRITWQMILNQKRLIIQEKKTKKVREIPIQDELGSSISEIHLKLNKPELSEFIVPLTIRGVNKQLKVYSKRAGIKNKRISTHSFRKTFGREVWKRNGESEASLIKLSTLFNHSSTSITRIYLSITKEEIDDLYDIQDLFI